MRLVALAAIAFFGPGLPAAWILHRRYQGTWASILATAGTLTLAFLGICGFFARVLGLGLDAVGVGVMLIASGALFWAIVDTRRGSRPVGLTTGWPGLLLALGAGSLAHWQRPWFGFTSDLYYHLAAARSLIVSGSPLVTDPLYGTGSTILDPTSGVYHTWLALVSAQSGFAVDKVHVGFNAVAAAFLVLAMWSLAHRLSGSQVGATVAVLGLIGLSQYSDLRSAGYPNRFSPGALMVAIIWARELFDRFTVSAFAGLALALFATTATHLGTGLYAVVVMAFLVLAVLIWWLTGNRGKGSLSPVLNLCAALAIAGLAVIPFVFSRVKVLMSAQNFASSERVELPSAAVRLIGPLVILAPGAYLGGGPLVFLVTTALAITALTIGIRRRDADAFVLGAVGSIPFVLTWFVPIPSLGLALSPYNYARLALVGGFVPWLALAWAVGAVGRHKGVLRGLFAASIAVFIGAYLFSTLPLSIATWSHELAEPRMGEAYTVFESRISDIRGAWGKPLTRLREEIDDRYPVVAASPETGYYLAGLADVAIIASLPSHSPLVEGLESGPQRLLDTEELMSPDTTEKRRRALLAKYNAQYVALSPGNGQDAASLASMLAQEELFEPVVESRRLWLLRVLPAVESGD